MRDACPEYERELAGGRPVIGVDEVGRGPLAGPVVAAAAYLETPIKGLRDSKKLTEKRREALAHQLSRTAVIAMAGVSASLIDRLGIGAATRLAMARAVAKLPALEGALVLVDGNQPIEAEGYDVLCEVKADATCPSVSAAAIAAKVARDRAMGRLAIRFPEYQWHTNKGYGSAAHREAILRCGPTGHHRQSFLTKILS
jgi:ribonuclease HII